MHAPIGRTTLQYLFSVLAVVGGLLLGPSRARAGPVPGESLVANGSGVVTRDWVARYDGSASGDDRSAAVAVDNSGNVYVTGYSTGSVSGTDYATAKYASDGTVLWTKSYNGSANGSDEAVAVAVDNQGNVYVTGLSEGVDTGNDYLTIKYGPDGRELWTRRCNGPGNGSGPCSSGGAGSDRPVGLVVDRQGNAYVTGSSQGPDNLYDYATVKYGPDGSELWARRFRLPDGYDYHARDIAIDSAGNVYVAGQGYDIDPSANYGYDFAIVKYGPDGSLLWVGYYPPLGFQGGVQALAVDALGNAYVTGWVEGAAVNCVTVKFGAADGHMVWERYYHGPDARHAWNSGNDIAVDGSGNVYVTGGSGGSGGHDDYATIKYGPDGDRQWVARYDGPANGDDVASAIAVDALGNAYVTGSSFVSSGEDEFATIKYGPKGSEQWAQRYNGPGKGIDEPRAIAVDGAGNVYVTGDSFGLGTGYDYATIKYTGVPDFKQRDLGWGNDHLAGKSGCPTVAVAGCALTSVADVLAYYGTPQLTQGYGPVSPDNLNRWLTAHGGYGGCKISWEVAANSTGGYVGEPTILRTSQYDLAAREQAIDNALSQGRPPIVEVKGKLGIPHWIVLSGKSGDSYSIVDPDGPSGGKLGLTYGAFYDVVIYGPGAPTG